MHPKDRKSICCFIYEAAVNGAYARERIPEKKCEGKEIAQFHLAKLETLRNRIDYPRLSRTISE